MRSMTVLAKAAVEEKLESLTGWRIDEAAIVRDYEFASFAAAMKFVNEVAVMAEAANHHPDIDIRYNKVRLTLSSHDAGGITQRDLDLAAALDPLFP